MASACVNNIGISSESFLDCTPSAFPSFGWLSPRVSFDREESSVSTLGGGKPKSAEKFAVHALEISDPDPEASPGDFEFRLDDPVMMLPADELFSDGKLVPLHLSYVKPSVDEFRSVLSNSPEMALSCRRTEISTMDPYLFSPKAPRCSSRWKELFGLKKLHQNANSKNENRKTTASSSFNGNPKSLKYFLHRSSKSLSSSSSDVSLTLPLLKDLDCDSVSVSSSRVSLSSSSSGREYEDLPRLSLDSDKPCSNQNPKPVSNRRHLNPNGKNAPRMRMVKLRAVQVESTPRSVVDHLTGTKVGRSPTRRTPPAESAGVECRGVSLDSPRMNASGKIVFQSLERSSSSPSTFNGGPRFKHRGMERSYSSNVRVTPVLNVPVCSLRGSSKSVSVFGFGQLFTSLQKKDANGSLPKKEANGIGVNNKAQHSINWNRTDRTCGKYTN